MSTDFMIAWSPGGHQRREYGHLATVMANDGNRTKLTKRTVDGAVPAGGRYFLWDLEVKGFGLKVEPSGIKTYFVRYRPRGLGQSAPKRFVTLGRHGPLTADEARKQAQILIGQVAVGQDPAGAIADSKQSKTFKEIADKFLAEHVATKRMPSTRSLCETLLRKHALPSLGNRKADLVTRADVAKLHVAMAHSPHNANRLVAVIGSLYSYAGKHGLIREGVNPARHREIQGGGT
jgi:hypothetical protein